MGRLNESEFKVQIKSGEYSPAYFIYGSEGYLRKYYVEIKIKRMHQGRFVDLIMKR